MPTTRSWKQLTRKVWIQSAMGYTYNQERKDSNCNLLALKSGENYLWFKWHNQTNSAPMIFTHSTVVGS